MSAWKYVFIIVTIAFFVSCKDRKMELSDSDIFGSWSGTIDNVGGSFAKNSRANIVLREDHTFQAHNIPILKNWNTAIPEMFNFTGSWEIQRDKSNSYQVLLDYKLNDEHWGMPLPVAKTWKGFELELGIDPNENTKVLFYKSKHSHPIAGKQKGLEKPVCPATRQG